MYMAKQIDIAMRSDYNEATSRERRRFILQNDFSKGRVWRRIVSQALPLTLAQLTQLLYNIVDRIYIGHLPGADSTALTGLGLTFPIVTLIAAFTALFATGGTPLFSIARGAGEQERASTILGNVFSLLLGASALLMLLCYLFKQPLLYLFGASDASYAYANAYLVIYLLGTPFSMLTTGLNGFINAQGFPRIGMFTTVIGALINLVLDPVFIFLWDMGVAGAALATLISQAIACIWVLRFITGKRVPLRLERRFMRISLPLLRQITSLGLSGFIMQGTNCAVQIVCNATLHTFGGDLYVGMMTVINSVRSVLDMPVFGINNGAQPVLGFNYGAKRYDRVREGIRFTASIGVIYTLLAWLIVFLFPAFFIGIFTSDAQLIAIGPESLRLYFFGFFFMSFQFAGQTAFTALGFAKQAIFFSLLRKAVIVVPLTLLLPRLGLGVNGVFLAEPISNAIGGLACFITMYFTLYKKLGKT